MGSCYNLEEYKNTPCNHAYRKLVQMGEESLYSAGDLLARPLPREKGTLLPAEVL